MKRFLSLLIAVLMVVGMLPVVSMAASAETIFVRCDDITLPQGSTEFTLSSPGANWYSVLSDNGTNLPTITTAGKSTYATATIEVDGNNGEAKTYYVWALAQAERPTGVAFDDSTSFTRLNTYDSADEDTTSGGKGMAWSTTTGSGFSLTPGVHTMKIRQDSDNTTNIQGFLITDDATFKPTVASTTYADILALVATEPEPEPEPEPDPEPEDGYENVLLGYENFVMPDYNNVNSGLWDASAEANKNRDGNYLFEKSMWLNNNANTLYTHARFYVGTTGTYKVWMLSRDDESTAATPSTTRIPTVGIDNANMVDGEAHATLSWSATEWTLDAGWHSIYLGIKNAWGAVKINAIYITNNSDYTPSVYTDHELLAYKFTAVEPTTKWMLTWNNFNKPDYTSWTYQPSTSLSGGKSIQPNTLSTDAGSTTAKAKASFYVEEAGNYAVWVLSRNGTTGDGRTAKIYVDGVADTTAYNDSTSFVWGKGTGPENGNGSWSLEKGWHTVEFGLSAAWKPYDMNAIYITSDLTETVTTVNDDALLAAYGDNSLCVDGDYYLTDGLEKGGYVIDDASVNITPVFSKDTTDTHTVTVNGASAAWNTANAVSSLNKGINTVAVDSTDDTVDCTFPVVSTAKVINHTDSAATITGGVESDFVGADGVTKAVYLDSADDSAKFSAEGITGNVQVWVYVIGASTDSNATTSKGKTADDALISIKDSNGTTPKQIDNTRTTSSWINYGTYSFSGSADEYVEIKGNETEHVYVDSVKFVYVDEYLFSEPVISTDGKFSVTYDCYKQTDDNTTIAAITAKYTGDVMNGASVNRLTHTDKGIYKITTNAFDITDGASYKAFIWDSTDNATPLAGAVVYPEAE